MKLIFYIFFLLVPTLCLSQENLEIKKIITKGNSPANNSLIKESLSLESTSWFKRKILKKNPVLFTRELYQSDISYLKKEYQKNGYLNVSFDDPQIEITDKQKIILTIFINEGEPVRISEVSYEVDSTMTLEEALPKKEKRNILLQSQLSESKVFRDKAFYNDQLLIAEELSNIGYPFAKVDYNLDVDTIFNTANLHWKIGKGQLSYFGLATIMGNDRVPAKSIARLLTFNPGEIWSKKQIDETQKRIYNLGMFRMVSVRAITGEQKTDTLPVQIQIREAPRWTTRFGVGYGREDKFRTFADLQYLGFITNTGRLNLYGKHSGLEPYNFSVKFSQPSVIFPINTLSINPYIQSENEPGYYLEKVGFNISMLQNFSKKLNTSIGYQFEDVKLDTTNTSGEKYLPEESYYKKSGIILGGIYTSADPLLDPVQGNVISVNIKTNGLTKNKDLPFNRILVEYKKYIGLRNGIILALKAKAGSIYRTDKKNFIPADERFYVGGSYSVRGWSRSDLGPKNENGEPIGGKSLLEGSAEFRFNAGKMVIFSLFCDAGNIWTNSFYYRLNDLHYAGGAGLKIKTPIGPIGMDLARPIFEDNTKWQFHFNIGHSF